MADTVSDCYTRRAGARFSFPDTAALQHIVRQFHSTADVIPIPGNNLSSMLERLVAAKNRTVIFMETRAVRSSPRRLVSVLFETTIRPNISYAAKNRVREHLTEPVFTPLGRASL